MTSQAVHIRDNEKPEQSESENSMISEWFGVFLKQSSDMSSSELGVDLHKT